MTSTNWFARSRRWPPRFGDRSEGGRVPVAGRARAGSPRLATLSLSRDSEVLAAIAQGITNAAIAASLHLSQRAVEKHINSIFAN